MPDSEDNVSDAAEPNPERLQALTGTADSLTKPDFPNVTESKSRTPAPCHQSHQPSVPDFSLCTWQRDLYEALPSPGIPLKSGESRDHFVEEHVHRQVRWSKAAFDGLKSKGEKPSSFLTSDYSVVGPEKAEADMVTQFYVKDGGHHEGLVEHHLHRHLRWSSEAAEDPSGSRKHYPTALPFDLQMNGVVHSLNGMEHDMHTHVHLEEDEHQEMRLELDWHRQTRWPRQERKDTGQPAGGDEDPAEPESQHIMEEHLHQQIRWSRAAFDSRRSAADAAAPALPGIPMNGVPHLNGSKLMNGVHTPPQDGLHHVQWLRQSFGPVPLNRERADGLLLKNGFHKPKENGRRGPNGHILDHRTEGGLEGKVLLLPNTPEDSSMDPTATTVPRAPNRHHTNGKLLNGLHDEGHLTGVPASAGHVLAHGINGTKGPAAMQWSPQAYEQLQMNGHGAALQNFTMQGILHPFNGVCNDLRLQVDGMRALQDQLAHLYDEAHRLNGDLHLKGHQDGHRQLTAPQPLNGFHHDRQVQVAALNGISTNGHCHLLNGSKKAAHHEEDLTKVNGHTSVKMEPSKAAEDSGDCPCGLWPPKLNHHVRSLPADLEMQGIVHPHRKPLKADGDADPESDEEEPLLNGAMHDPPLERRDPSPPLLGHLSAVHAPTQPKGSEVKVESQPWWSEEAFNGLPLSIGSAILPLPLKEEDDPHLKNGHVTNGQTDSEFQQQLLVTQSIIRDLMRENADMRQQIEESEVKEKRWRAEKQRLHKEILFQRTSISTLQDANAHLQHEVDELRALGDTLLSQIKQKMKNGLHPKFIGSQ